MVKRLGLWGESNSLLNKVFAGQAFRPDAREEEATGSLGVSGIFVEPQNIDLASKEQDG